VDWLTGEVPIGRDAEGVDGWMGFRYPQPNTESGPWGTSWAPPAESGAELRPKMNLVTLYCCEYYTQFFGLNPYVFSYRLSDSD